MRSYVADKEPTIDGVRCWFGLPFDAERIGERRLDRMVLRVEQLPRPTLIGAHLVGAHELAIDPLDDRVVLRRTDDALVVQTIQVDHQLLLGLDVARLDLAAAVQAPGGTLDSGERERNTTARGSTDETIILPAAAGC